jgi:hypothetical protein
MRFAVHGRAARIAAALVIGIAAAVGATYYLTYEPAASVRVRWRADVTPEVREQLERAFLLVGRAAHEGSARVFQYDLLDTSRANIEALVTHPAVEDTDEIDRQNYGIRIDGPYGGRWMWIAHRVPIIRQIAPAFRRAQDS